MAIPDKGDFGLAGRVCVVTGGGSGIGRGIAIALATEGATIAILDRNEAGAEETLGLVSATGAKGIALACDVSDQHSVEAASATVRDRFGDANVLVNNAAILRPGSLADLPLTEWNALLAVNLTGYFLCAQRDVSAYALKRIANPAEIARAILFLTSWEASYVTGAALPVDGRRTFH